jgi:hypothetical protein
MLRDDIYLLLIRANIYLRLQNPDFNFLQNFFKGVKSDGKLLDIYHGEVIQVTSAGIGITPNIPLDPIGADKTPRRIVWERRWLVLQHAISVSGIVMTALGIYISPVWYMWVFLAVHVFVYFGFMKFVKPKNRVVGDWYRKKNQQHLLAMLLFVYLQNNIISLFQHR